MLGSPFSRFGRISNRLERVIALLISVENGSVARDAPRRGDREFQPSTGAQEGELRTEGCGGRASLARCRTVHVGARNIFEARSGG